MELPLTDQEVAGSLAADPAGFADAVAGVMLLRVAMMDRHGFHSGHAERALTTIMDNESTDMRVRGLAASALLEPSWLRAVHVFVPRPVKRRARQVLSGATKERLAAGIRAASRG